MYDYEEEFEEKPRHRKMTLTKKKKTKKADHKHIYHNCSVSYVAEDNFGKRYHLYSPAKYCTICGNLESEWRNFRDPNSIDRSLPIFNVEMWAKKVDL